jgi:hypothetical protein
MQIETLLNMNQKQLHQTLKEGHAVDPTWLDDTEYHGISLGLPAFMDHVAWKTFQKSFHRDPETGKLRGFNVRLEQTGVKGPVKPLIKKGVPKSFGHFAVVSLENKNAPGKTGPGVLLDYGRGKNHSLDPIRFLRDPLVALEPDDPSLLFGWSYVELGKRRISTPSFFALRRHGPLSFVPEA